MTLSGRPRMAGGYGLVRSPSPFESFDSRIAGSKGTLITNRIYLTLAWNDSDRLISAVKVNVGTASGNLDAGVFTFDGTQFVLVASSGSTAAAGTNAIQTLTLTTPYQYRGGTGIYLAVQADNATVTILRNGGASGEGNAVNLKTVSKTPGALGLAAASPITLASATLIENVTPWIAAA